MKRWLLCIIIGSIILLCCACSSPDHQPNIVATTLPVFTFSRTLCDGTPLTVDLLVQENISCLHDYTLSVKHMKMLENADLVVLSGGGMEDFLIGALPDNKPIIDASAQIELQHFHEHHDSDHHHENDPHFWLSISNAQFMARSICEGLAAAYPQYKEQFDANMLILDQSFDALFSYAQTQLADLNCRQIITFHDGFSYMAEEFGLTILHSVEEESGSEASAKELIQICDLVDANALPAVFIETNGSASAAKLISNETGAKLYSLDMALSGSDYFQAMYRNINTLKEALG